MTVPTELDTQSQQSPLKSMQSNKDILIHPQNNTYNYLQNCTLSLNWDSKILNQSSLLFENIKKSVIVLNRLYFENGNIFINDCEDTVIIVNMEKIDNSIQLRFHNLVYCKIYIQRKHAALEPTVLQKVIIENFRGCTFHTDSKDYIMIENFSNLGMIKSGIESTNSQGYTLNSDGSSAYNFQNFSYFDNDVLKLKENYVL
ncbi:hypothetical protein TPHA_0D03520 [Tetrapisispora phaffii CBS 4417]|uniref:C-CAP/cofactor C-like domain-containing protein n=1 Tax=Tetrapisispora phaffii (strain ATCC 24235 / CBS 4417 / NBRC 1672 / NRRL Y-8282 / UCD 70-5) TaxID=1071381 RepID=G8BT16_TETPH|nr:hypothetical protein TPHA_0D03520 [Tetrapisispora phaffii CBS 4417]CCE62987.1 hypothetical protein TPHA_0D03520 [Tetrapisispora phaffii CBS 4417]